MPSAGIRQPLDIAIAGGGIASMCLARALGDIPNLRVQIFEARQDPGEDGQAFGLGSNAQRALELMDPILRSAIDRAGGVRMDPSARVMMASPGQGHGEWIADIGHEIPQIIVGRGAFQRELQKTISHIPIHTGQRIIKVEDQAASSTGNPCQVKIHLEDGSSRIVDAVIGCDGVNSVVRTAVLLPEHPESVKSSRSGSYHSRTIIPIQDGINAFGDEYCKLKVQNIWIGNGCVVLTDRFDDGKKMQLITNFGGKRTWDREEDWGVLDGEVLKQDLAMEFGDFGKEVWAVRGLQWSGNPCYQCADCSLKAHQRHAKIYAGAVKTHVQTPTYAKGNMCLLGDAAQTISPAQGAGAGQAIEDALALATVMAFVQSPEDIAKAFQVYDSVRRPRRSDVARSSGEAGLFLRGRLEGVGLDMEKMRQYLSKWADNVHNYDAAKMVQELKERMR
ncbi:hypothetical protein M409DRAFT_71561 [Zasmidium cellare ATCC 36951]|uniref:FAD-binding domain-containing protein n=1 Tax=Zasmidium cellare ATCC 36951 TaxID=1080233 RepID=A0A6A6BYH7_ZASCE|nr:uncharacterized protein M409DRAFT_71561 [Zasmidium cellare ATCC 36951]KAF2158579.1 hypothetical protein M409DRAFT_71561 [Zasmidium cellare ATCC 36951]